MDNLIQIPYEDAGLCPPSRLFDLYRAGKQIPGIEKIESCLQEPEIRKTCEKCNIPVVDSIYKIPTPSHLGFLIAGVYRLILMRHVSEIMPQTKATRLSLKPYKPYFEVIYGC